MTGEPLGDHFIPKGQPRKRPGSAWWKCEQMGRERGPAQPTINHSSGSGSIPILFFPILFYSEQYVQNIDVETQRTGTKTNRNSRNYSALMSCIIKCMQYNQLKFQCLVVVFTSVQNGLTKRDKSRGAWSTNGQI